MKKYQAGFVVWGLTYFLYATALIGGIIVVDKAIEDQAVAEQENPVTAPTVTAEATLTPDTM